MKLQEVAQLTGACLRGDPEKEITGIEALENAGSSDLSFLANSRYESSMRASRAGAIFVSKEVLLPEGGNFLIVADPSKAFQQAVALFCQQRASGFVGIHPTAVIHELAVVAPSATLAPYAVIDAYAVVEGDTFIGPHAVVGAYARIGTGCMLHAHSVVREGSILEAGVTLQPGAVVGSCGFGYIADAAGAIVKLDQLGIVYLETGVEIGANSAVDRARFKETRIGAHSKIDNLCQIAHNVQIGQANFIAAQTGIAGSTKTGNGCMFGGQAAAIGHLEIADGTKIAARGALSKSIKEPGQAFSGAPAAPIHEHNRAQAHMRRLESYAKRIAELEKRLALLEIPSVA